MFVCGPSESGHYVSEDADGIEPKRGIDWFALWSRLSASEGGDCANGKKWAESSEPHSHDGKVEIKGLRNCRMIYRDINIILKRGYVSFAACHNSTSQKRIPMLCPNKSIIGRRRLNMYPLSHRFGSEEAVSSSENRWFRGSL